MGMVEALHEAIQDRVDRFFLYQKGFELGQKQAIAWFDKNAQGLQDKAIRAALEKMGLPIEDGPINEQTITDAINAGPLGALGLDLHSLFNADALKASLKRIAIAKFAERMGFPEVTSIPALKAAVLEMMAGEIAEQVASEAGPLFEGAPNVAQIMSAIKAKKPDGWNDPTDFSPKGISNRERQATYRASHRRHWEDR